RCGGGGGAQRCCAAPPAGLPPIPGPGGVEGSAGRPEATAGKAAGAVPAATTGAAAAGIGALCTGTGWGVGGAVTAKSSILVIWSVGTPILPPPSISRMVNLSPFSTLLTMIALPLTK